MAQLLLHGTNFVNFVGLHALVGLDGGFQATRVTEWDEPQAVIGSYLQRFAYPDWWRLHVDRNKRELIDWTRSAAKAGSREQFANVVQDTGGAGRLPPAARRIYVRRRGQRRLPGLRRRQRRQQGRLRADRHRALLAARPRHAGRTRGTRPAWRCRPTSRSASAATTPSAATIPENQEQAFHPLYRYAVVTDSEEGLILVDVDTLADGEPRNNFLKRAADLERRRRAERRPPRHARRPLRLHRRGRGPRRRRPRRPAAPAPRRHRPAARRPRLGAPVPLSVGDRRRRPQAARRHPDGLAPARPLGDRSRSPTPAGSMSPAPTPMSRPSEDGLVDRRRHPARGAARLPAARPSAAG